MQTLLFGVWLQPKLRKHHLGLLILGHSFDYVDLRKSLGELQISGFRVQIGLFCLATVVLFADDFLLFLNLKSEI